MALATAVISFDISDLVGTGFDASKVRAWTTTNADNNRLLDTAANLVRMGDGKVTVTSDGTGSFSVWVPGADGNPTSWQQSFVFEYPLPGARGRTTTTFGPYTITGSASLADLDQEQAIPPTYLSEVTGALSGYVDDAADFAAAAAASAASAYDISNISTSDGVVSTLVADPDSDTAVALATSQAATSGTSKQRARLLDVVNPLDRRRVPTVGAEMAAPPTVTRGTAGAGTTISNGLGYYLLGDNSPSVGIAPAAQFRAFGGKVESLSNGLYNNARQLLAATSSTSPCYVDFMIDAPKFEVNWAGGTEGYYRVRVNGELVDDAVYPVGASSAGERWDLYDFGSSQPRHIELEMANLFRLNAVFINNAYGIWQPETFLGPRVTVLGDSFHQGIGADSLITSTAALTYQSLGYKDVWNCSVGGTGYLSDGGGTGGKTKLRDRLQHDCYDYSPDVVVVAMGTNDYLDSKTPSLVQAEALACYQDIKTHLPDCTLIVVGLTLMVHNPDSDALAINTAISNAVTAAGDLVDLYIKPIQGASGNVGNWITVLQQASRLRDPDNLHPAQPGHNYLAQRESDAIRAALPITA